MNATGSELLEKLNWLSEYGKDEDGGITRFLYSKEWKDAQCALKEWLEAEGFRTHEDHVGNLFATIEGSEQPEEVILTGSHLDTVRCGGYYDGQYGIIGGALAIKKLVRERGVPKKSLQLVAFAEEEGSRFPTAMWGSKSIVHQVGAEDVRGLVDASGAVFEEEMSASGYELGVLTPKREDIATFVELHIEQGNVLEQEGLSVGVVDSIVGQRRLTITLTGESNHAGTTPMGYRKDTMHLASELISETLDQAREAGDPLVATVGQLQLGPNVVNVVPGKATFTVDIRHTDQEALTSFSEMVIANMKEKAAVAGIGIDVDLWMDAPPVPMSERVVTLMEGVCDKLALSYKTMHSGAGHDAQVFAPLVPTAMLFVPSKKGISHSPFEHTDEADLLAGVHALQETLFELAY
ncbi:allantoate deiminase [Shouchella shacheensis]|uniref:allantoate deiminase n=1 Tax=Shouchella shacheensis TaxID=1649580 RepID=UPI0007405449|nr:allantoate deiminase [Shouchella shacheensis]